jgi:hypothetical protein
MATVKLIGHDDATGANEGANWFELVRFQAINTGSVTEFKVKSEGSYNVKVALYADRAGEPGALITAMNTGQAVASDWNILSFTTTNITSGTYYWLAIIGDASGAFQSTFSGDGTRRYKAGTYSIFSFPDPAGSGFYSDTYGLLLAGWGILVLSPSSIIQPVSYGTPTVQTSAIIIYPSSIVQVVAIGTPSLFYPQSISPSSIIVTIAYGTPSVGIVGQAGYIYPQSIIQQIAIGSPTLLKYVWHVILDGQYLTETPGVNLAYIIGRDQYGNPVYGEAQDATEIGLVGERLDFQPDPAIPTTAQAADVASAILSKMRLTKARGVILIPPNCGQELFDVVQLTDSQANQSAVKFRVVGLRFEYNPKQARYQHKLILGAP